MVAKINFSGDNGEDHLRATGVDVIVGGKTFTVNAGKEVLLCAGVIQSPQLLEVSGIGSQSRLEQYGIKTLIDNPNVGENLQDHVMVPMAWEVVDGEKTLEAVRDPGVLNFVMQAYQTACAGPLANSATSVAFLPYATITGNDEVSTEKEVAEIFSAALPAQSTVTSKQNDLLRSQLLDPSNASTQFIVVPTGSDPSSTGVSAMFHHSISWSIQHQSHMSHSAILSWLHPYSICGRQGPPDHRPGIPVASHGPRHTSTKSHLCPEDRRDRTSRLEIEEPRQGGDARHGNTEYA
jgi:choline dehydrogenase-like flavoprotein